MFRLNDSTKKNTNHIKSADDNFIDNNEDDCNDLVNPENRYNIDNFHHENDENKIKIPEKTEILKFMNEYMDEDDKNNIIINDKLEDEVNYKRDDSDNNEYDYEYEEFREMAELESYSKSDGSREQEEAKDLEEFSNNYSFWNLNL